MVTHAAVVWWSRVGLGVTKTMLGRLQRLACLAITGATRTTPTAAMEVLLGLPSLDIHIKEIAMNTCYRMNSTGSWRGSGARTNHTRIMGKMGMEIPVTKCVEISWFHIIPLTRVTVLI